MSIELGHRWELRKKILAGVTLLGDCVGSTLGPKGQNVLIHKKDKTPFITKDGVTVAANISFDDPFMNSAAEIVKQVSAKTNLEAGDGTTTSTVLACSLFRESFEKLGEGGSSPVEIKRGLEQCLSSALNEVAAASKPITSLEEIEQVATISANNDSVIGKLIATAVDKVGHAGSIAVEEGRSMDTTLELVEGFSFDAGYAAAAFVTDERRKTIKYEQAMFLITDEKVTRVEQILPALEIAAREGRALIIIAEEVEGQALAALIMNTVRGSMKVAAVKAPRYGEERVRILEDLSVATGATFFKRHSSSSLEKVELGDFGNCELIEVTKSSTTVVDGHGSPEEILNRIEEIKKIISSTEDIREAERQQERVTRLSSGVAIIKVGASSQVEMVEKKHRIEDALEAVYAAQASGVLPGGGSTLLRVSRSLSVEFENEEQRPALDIFKKSLLSPFEQMCINAGVSPTTTMEQVLSSDDPFVGFDFRNCRMTDMYESGIIDPAKVLLSAIRNAVSVAATLLLTNHAIIEK